MGSIVTGYVAIGMKEDDDRIILNKYADPTDVERTDITIGEALDIADEDPSLVWCEL